MPGHVDVPVGKCEDNRADHDDRPNDRLSDRLPPQPLRLKLDTPRRRLQLSVVQTDFVMRRCARALLNGEMLPKTIAATTARASFHVRLI